MKAYTKEEVKWIKVQEWDKGWRWGLLAASILWVGIIVIIIL